MTFPSPNARPWRPTPLIRATYAVHGVAAAGLVLAPQVWPWSLAALAANHAALTAAGLWPRGAWLGPNWVRLPAAAAARGEIALSFDDGPDPDVTPRVLAMLREAGVRATFFVIGARAEAHPALLRAIVDDGHALENHSQVHRHDFSLLGPRGFAREIAAAQHTLTRLGGRRPRFFRAPAGLRNPFLEPVLAREGLWLASWTRRGFDTRQGEPARVLARLTAGLAAGDILLLHDGHAARGEDGRPVVLAALPELLARIAGAGLRPVTLADCLPDVEPPAPI